MGGRDALESASSFLLSAKAAKETWLEPIVDKAAKSVPFHIRYGGTKAEINKANEGAKAGRAVFRCIFSDAPIPGEYIDARALEGKIGAMLIAIAVEERGKRVYLAPNIDDQRIAVDASTALVKSVDLSAIEVPCRGTFASNALGRRYRFNTFRDYFGQRQLVASNTFSGLIAEVGKKVREDMLRNGSLDPGSPRKTPG
jgi:putative DNA methylase